MSILRTTEQPYERMEYENSVIEIVNAIQEPDGLGIDRLNARLLNERMQSNQSEPRK